MDYLYSSWVAVPIFWDQLLGKKKRRITITYCISQNQSDTFVHAIFVYKRDVNILLKIQEAYWACIEYPRFACVYHK